MKAPRKPVMTALIAVALVVILGFFAVFALGREQNKIVEWSDWIYLNGVRYDPYYGLENYHTSNVLICSTPNGGKAYEIEEYPNREFIVLYYAWDGTVYKRAGERFAGQ